MVTKILKDDLGQLNIEILNNNLKRITALPSKGTYFPDSKLLTKYPIDLIKYIFDRKGCDYVIDEIRRDESPDYVYKALKFGLFSFVDEKDLENKTLLDFGCGSGASSCILGRQINNIKIIGVELDESLLEIAEMRKKYYKLQNKVSFIKSKNPESLPIQDKVDYVLLSAVYEHLLPHERKNILKMCWQILKKNGIIFINQTPNRWCIYENHTTNLFIINYLPDKICHLVAKKFSKRNLEKFSWNELLRKGIRGATEKEIINNLKKLNELGEVKNLNPTKFGLNNKIDLWYKTTTTFSVKSKILKLTIRFILKFLPFLGKILLPGLNMAICKKYN
tara:strand:- start:873 stop:1877 length:1005 start_codon:yes stop_codon:yes gene_type:complete